MREIISRVLAYKDKAIVVLFVFERNEKLPDLTRTT